MKNILAIITGVIIGSAVLLIVGMIANNIQPTPPELMDPKTPEEVARRVEAASNFTWITTIFGLALGAFMGSFVGIKIVKEQNRIVTVGIGFLLSVWALYTFYIVYPTVLWVPLFMLLSVILFSYMGGRAGSR